MIFCLIFVFSAILFLVLNIVMKKLFFAKVEHGEVTAMHAIRFCSLALIIVLMLLPSLFNRLLEPRISYDSFENYLFWSEGYRTEGFMKAESYLKVEQGYLYSLDDMILSGLARETKDGKFKKNSVKKLNQKMLEADAVTVMLIVYENSEEDLRIFLFLEMSGKEYEASVNGQEAVVYYDSANWHYKVCVLDRQKNYSILCNGKTFES